ncbi:efflux RND transporter periplasmic adaptor subunit [Hymenobacter arizonensis]|uniref:Membrane fusion protein, cobalt-zinc-cadmium efflux system n=1 Tax=Hymenobacter arizonensis TaxID=1227077 RepID=A0A1I5T2K9_HYMAR|nr:efflux RND transporter periplasmic adaptor subunit [Hymenobacter arizonensis]SFP77270.1 membrane fusion protein, cobalt-zinc-cadmium efflux system [Hymenobacter arizonensis]
MKNLSLGLLAAVVLVSCQKTEIAEEQKPAFKLSDTMVKQMELDTVRLRPVRSELMFSGQVVSNGDQTAKVFPLVGGVVENLKVELGDHVTKGQLLAIVRSGEIADVQNQSSSAGTDLAIAQKNLAVAEDQFAAGLASERDVVLAREEARRAAGNANKSRKQLGIYGVTADGRYAIKAPISGFITEKNVTESMQYTDSNVDHFFTIANLDQVWVMANVFETDIAKVKVGYDAEVTTLAYPDKHFRGKVDKVFNVLDPSSKVMKVRVRLENPGYLLKPEMYAQVRIENTEANQMLTVPAKSVIFDKDRNFVLVYKDRQHVETRPVTILKTVGDYSYVNEGLKPGEVVIAKEQLLIYDELND